ncbi:MAG: putative metabolite transport protein NicT [Pseudomonas fluorescens]|nr:MAG: putative metabolite transport protein NicT [Pseudomonas fluorescens]
MDARTVGAATVTAQAHPGDSHDALYRKVFWRFVPLLMLGFMTAYLDRVNIGFAKLQMQQDLHFSDTIYGLGAGIFFIGYFLFEVPSNVILHRIGARRWLARIMVTWGVLSALTMFVTTPMQFYVLRFLLGLSEAGFLPGVLLYLTYWFPSARRGRIIALCMMAVPLSAVIGNPLTGWIMHTFDGLHGWAGWQWVFLLEAMPAVILGVLVLKRLDDRVERATWLGEKERSAIAREITCDAVTHEPLGMWQLMSRGRVWGLALIYFCLSMGLYGVSFWMPTIIRNSGVTDTLHIGLLTAIPPLFAVLGMVANSTRSDRCGERRWHTAIPAFCAAIGFVACALWSSNTLVALCALTVANVGVMSAVPVFWTLPTVFLGGAAAAVGIALINSFGNLSGFVSTYLVGALKDLTGSTDSGIYVIAACLLTAGLTALAQPKPLKQ